MNRFQYDNLSNRLSGSRVDRALSFSAVKRRRVHNRKSEGYDPVMGPRLAKRRAEYDAMSETDKVAYTRPGSLKRNSCK